MAKPFDSDILIVGAGISGLMAATELQSRGMRVLVVEQGRVVGGRMATRRVGPGLADYGAQFFTVRTRLFQTWVSRWLAQDQLFHWSNGWSSGSLRKVRVDGHSRYAVSGGMAALPAYLAASLDVRTGVNIEMVEPDDHGWRAQDVLGNEYRAAALLLTMPLPQAIGLLAEHVALIPSGPREILEEITFAPCLAGMFWVEGELLLPPPGAFQRPHQPIQWIADNHLKGISPDAHVVTVHAGAQYSAELWGRPDEAILSELKHGFSSFRSSTTVIHEAQLKRWYHALPEKTYTEFYWMSSGLPLLALAGDAFGGPRVEGAALSGMAVGEAVARRLQGNLAAARR